MKKKSRKVVPFRGHPLLPSIELIETLGTVIVAWSAMEFSIDAMLWHLAGMGSADGTKITSRMALRAKTEAIVDLSRAHITSKPIKRRLKRLADHVHDLAFYRNLVAHGLWTQAKNGSIYVTATRLPAPYGKFGTRRITLQKLRDLLHDMAIVQTAFWEFALHGPAWPQPRLPRLLLRVTPSPPPSRPKKTAKVHRLPRQSSRA